MYRGEGPYGLPDGTGSPTDKLAKKYENPANVSDSVSVSELFRTSSCVDGVVAMPHRLDAVDVVA